MVVLPRDRPIGYHHRLWCGLVVRWTGNKHHPVSHMCPEIEQVDSQEDLRSFHHARNKTGIVGGHHKLWSDDAQVNALWTRLSEPEPRDVSSVQRAIVRHVLSTLARTYFNMDSFAAYQAAAHT